MRFLFLCSFLLIASKTNAEPLFETAPVFALTPDNRPNYRIPSLIKAANGDLLVIAERRNDGPGDIGNHDIVLKRSTDQGRTWGEEATVLDDGDNVTTDITVGVIDGRIWLFFLRDKKAFHVLTSDDHGVTWQGPLSIHSQVTRPEWDQLQGKSDEDAKPPKNPKGRMAQWEKNWEQRYGIGPGNTVLKLQRGAKAGRIVVPARHREDIGKGRLRSFAHTFYSDDQGKSWKLGGNIGLNTSECQIVELTNGDLRVISRNESSEDAPDNLRHLTAVSRDGGETWVEFHRQEELITPRCHGPVERFTLAGIQGQTVNRLLFASPASPYRQPEHPYGRYNLTVRWSLDEGATWNAGRTIWPHPGSYADLVVLDDQTIGMIYERGDKGTTHYWDELHFVRYNWEWLTSGRESLASTPVLR